MNKVTVDSKTLLVARVNGSLYVMEGICSHRGGELWKGELSGYTVTCPRHGSQFDVRSGKNLKGPWIPFAKASDLKSYEVIEENDEVCLEM